MTTRYASLIQNLCNNPFVRLEFVWHGITRDRYMTSNWFKVADLEKQGIEKDLKGLVRNNLMIRIFVNCFWPQFHTFHPIDTVSILLPLYSNQSALIKWRMEEYLVCQKEFDQSGLWSNIFSRSRWIETGFGNIFLRRRSSRHVCPQAIQDTCSWSNHTSSSNLNSNLI